jgi:hypothetical protein
VGENEGNFGGTVEVGRFQEFLLPGSFLSATRRLLLPIHSQLLSTSVFFFLSLSRLGVGSFFLFFFLSLPLVWTTLIGEINVSDRGVAWGYLPMSQLSYIMVGCCKRGCGWVCDLLFYESCISLLFFFIIILHWVLRSPESAGRGKTRLSCPGVSVLRTFAVGVP